MTECNARVLGVETVSALESVLEAGKPNRHGAYVGLDVHKETIAVAVALPGREAPQSRGEIRHTRKAVGKLIERLSEEFDGQLLLFCYEAGPCGYGLYRQVLEAGHECEVVAPSLIPHKAGVAERADRRDARKLARYLRSGELTAVWVPDEEQEAMRDLCRARADMKSQERKAQQQLNAFVLRHGHHWPGDKTRWTAAHFNWLEELRFAHDWQQVVLQEYIEAVKAARERVAEMMQQMQRVLPQWRLAPVVDALTALRGIDQLSAMTLLAELGDISRFDSPRQLMAFLGLVPGEHSSGGRRRQGAITLTGNRHARRTLVESARSYRFPARQTAPEQAKAIGWRAQKRLCGRYRKLAEAGKNTKLVCVAIARELVGFVWDIVRQEMPRLKAAVS